MDHINFNGKILSAGSPIVTADSRGLKFGDGIFETMRYRNNDIALWKHHMQRFFKGLQFLKFEIPKHFTEEKIRREIENTLINNGHKNARIRLTVFRGNGGFFDPIDLHPNYLIQTWPLEKDFGSFNENGLKLGIYKDAIKACDGLSNIKHNNYLLPVMAGMYAKENKYNDALIVNHHGRVCETTIANIFMIKDEKLSTPALSEGCVEGTMRNLLLQVLSEIGFEVAQEEITINTLKEADEIFITNALRPLRWVSELEDKNYKNFITKKILDRLIHEHPQHFKF